MAQQKTQIEYINVDDLKAYERNARTHSDEQVKQVAESIKEFGFTQLRRKAPSFRAEI